MSGFRVCVLGFSVAMAAMASATVPAAADAPEPRVLSAKIGGEQFVVKTNVQSGKVTAAVSALQDGGWTSMMVTGRGKQTVRVKLSTSELKRLRTAQKVRVVATQRRADTARVFGATINPGKGWKASNSGGCANVIKRRADVRGCELVGADLRGMDLRGVDFRTANLSLADLRGARIGGAKLKSAVMVGARARRLSGVPASMPTRAVLKGGKLTVPAVWLSATERGKGGLGYLAACDPQTPDTCVAMDTFPHSTGELLAVGDTMYVPAGRVEDAAGGESVYACDTTAANTCTLFARLFPQSQSVVDLAYGETEAGGEVFVMTDENLYGCPLDEKTCVRITVIGDNDSRGLAYDNGWVYYGWTSSPVDPVYTNRVMRCRPVENAECEIFTQTQGAVTGIEMTDAGLIVATGAGFIARCDTSTSVCVQADRVKSVYSMTTGDGKIFASSWQGSLFGCDLRTDDSCNQLAELGMDPGLFNSEEVISYGQGSVYAGRVTRGVLQRCDAAGGAPCTIMQKADLFVFSVRYH